MIKKIIIKQPPKPKLQTNSNSSLYGVKLCIAYGTVDSNNDDGTCNVLLKSGFISTFKIPSTVWCSQEPITGGISYPPIGSEVKIEFPENDLNSGFIYPVNLNTRNSEVSSALLGQGDKTILPGGWGRTYDQEKGIWILTNGDFNLKIDPDGKEVSITDFTGNTIVMKDSKILMNGHLEVLQ